MYQKDFILRMIEMLAELIAGILGLIKKGDFQKASQSLESAYQDLLKEDSTFFNKIPLNVFLRQPFSQNTHQNQTGKDWHFEGF